MNGSVDGQPVEIPLSGGRYTVGVVRVGDTVRRPAQSSSAFVRELLLHLEDAGYACAPRLLGQDESGRDVFGYIPGWVPAKFQHFEDDQIATAAAMLRYLHDVTRGSNLTGSKEVVCHHDPGPNNVVFQEGRPVAFIDFDFAAPGAAIEDLGYMAWTWCVSSKAARGPAQLQAEQVRVLADAYGLDHSHRAHLVPAMIERQLRNITFWSQRINCFEGPPTSPDEIRERIDWSKREMQFTQHHSDLFSKVLGV